MSSMSQRPVARRQVFYIPGYDPLPPRRYRELYRTEAAAQSEISGYEIALKAKRHGSDGFSWCVGARIDGHCVDTEIHVLEWSDLVRDSLGGSIFRTYAALLRTAWVYIASGALWRLMRLRKGPVITALYPVVALTLQLCLAGAAAWVAFNLARRALASLVDAVGAAGITALAAVTAVLLAGALLRVFKAWDRRVYAHYLMHDFSYSSSLSGAYPAALDARLAQFRVRVAAALAAPVDEVLVVGHSSGAHLGVSLLADLIRSDAVPKSGPALAFLSLGQVVPMVSFLPRATRLRADLRVLSTAEDVTWVDVTAPGDGCCFALCDPVAVSGQATAEKRGPLVFSAAFTQSLSPARWKALRWRFFRLHLQYLCAFDRPKDYDYFQITAGPLRLADRYAKRPPSKSRLEKSVTGYTATAP